MGFHTCGRVVEKKETKKSLELNAEKPVVVLSV